MAKKKTKTTNSSTATKTRRPSAGKRRPARRRRSHRSGTIIATRRRRKSNWTRPKVTPSITSSNVRKSRYALEREVNTVVTQAVRKICKVHGKLLTVAQAQNVAMVLFGD